MLSSSPKRPGCVHLQSDALDGYGVKVGGRHLSRLRGFPYAICNPFVERDALGTCGVHSSLVQIRLGENRSFVRSIGHLILVKVDPEATRRMFEK